VGDYLLKPGETDPAVSALKTWLVRVGAAASALPAGDTYDPATVDAVKKFQKSRGATVDGLVGPATWALLGAALDYPRAEVLQHDELPAWVRSIVGNDPDETAPRPIDVAQALDIYQAVYGELTPSQTAGLTAILEAIAADRDVTDVRWAAYMLATVKWECGDTWRPIEEFSKGKGRPYGEPAPFTSADGIKHNHVYYGRGYVQLTHLGNYREVGRQIGLEDRLAAQPELALDPKVAYRIMSHGMRKGTFTGVGLKKFIAAGTCDYVNARRIINGTDQAARIADFARRLQIILLASITTAAGATLPSPGVGAARTT
jgi:hypothetical protein